MAGTEIAVCGCHLVKAYGFCMKPKSSLDDKLAKELWQKRFVSRVRFDAVGTVGGLILLWDSWAPFLSMIVVGRSFWLQWWWMIWLMDQSHFSHLSTFPRIDKGGDPWEGSWMGLEADGMVQHWRGLECCLVSN